MASPISYIETLRVGEIFANYDATRRHAEPLITLLSAIDDWKSKGLDSKSAIDILRGYAEHAEKICYLEAAQKAYSYLKMKNKENEIKTISKKTERDMKVLREELMNLIKAREESRFIKF